MFKVSASMQITIHLTKSFLSPKFIPNQFSFFFPNKTNLLFYACLFSELKKKLNLKWLWRVVLTKFQTSPNVPLKAGQTAKTQISYLHLFSRYLNVSIILGHPVYVWNFRHTWIHPFNYQTWILKSPCSKKITKKKKMSWFQKQYNWYLGVILVLM